MNRIARLTLVVCLLTAVAFSATAAIDGAWTSSLDEKRPDRMYFSITRGRSHQNGSTFPISSFAGLSAAQINAATMTPVQFAMKREAGTIAFEGTFRSGKGAGQFTFTPDRSYINAVRALGVEFESGRKRNNSEEDTLFSLALHDVSTAFIKTMIAEGYRVELDDYIALRIFDVTPEYIREMRSLGFRDLSHDDLVASRIHKVTPAYIREMRAAGWNLSLNELQASRIHGATPAFAEEMRKLGYGDLDHDDLIAFRIHRVTADFINGMKKLGYDNLSADQLVAMRIHRVTPEFIKELEAAGYVKVPVDKLVSMRIHGVDAKFIKNMSN
jgi:hypothetical protein